MSTTVLLPEDLLDYVLELLRMLVFVAEGVSEGDVDLPEMVLPAPQLLVLHLEEFDSVQKIVPVLIEIVDLQDGVAVGQDDTPLGTGSTFMHIIKITPVGIRFIVDQLRCSRHSDRNVITLPSSHTFGTTHSCRHSNR